MAIIAVYNIKGGVGKTATAVNLSYLAASQGKQVLLCDLDSQGSASYYFRIRPPAKFNVRRLLRGGKHIDRSIRGTDYPGLDLLPADFSFRHLDIALDGLKKSRKRLNRILRPLCREYDHIFLDCPPGITLLSENVFYAADIILVPLIPTTLSRLSLKQLLTFFREQGHPRSKLLVFFSMAEKRKSLHQEVMKGLLAKSWVLPCAIPFLADVEKMGIYRQPVTAALPRSTATRAYQHLWAKVVERLRS